MVKRDINVVMTNTEETYKDFYTVAEFAKKLGVHYNTIRRAIKNGKINVVTFGSDNKRIYRIPHTEIERILLFDMKKIFIDIVKQEMQNGK